MAGGDAHRGVAVRGARVIVVPWTQPHTQLADVLTGRTHAAHWVGDADTAYFDLLAGLWAAGETFTVVEHDIVPTAAALDSLDACDADWCACLYPYVKGWVMAGLGCTRFRGAIMRRHPDLFEVVGGMSDETHPAMHWCRLDAWIRNTLMGRGERRCENHGQVGHVMSNPGASAHGCFTG